VAIVIGLFHVNRPKCPFPISQITPNIQNPHLGIQNAGGLCFSSSINHIPLLLMTPSAMEIKLQKPTFQSQIVFIFFSRSTVLFSFSSLLHRNPKIVNQ